MTCTSAKDQEKTPEANVSSCPVNDAVSAPQQSSEECFRSFRNALGQFATGVTVVTSVGLDGNPIGLTISSFNSVSLDPPLILWSLSLNSPNLETFRKARYYAINILSAEQTDVSYRFASRVENRFSGISQRTGLGGAPLIDGCSAWFECEAEAQYPGGDHLILVGRVVRFAQGASESPLIFHNGRYRRLDPSAP
ncbi:MAG: flavin reductase family protein [Betaproteobacteria bacterium]